MPLVVIDADPIVYRCGFASERTSWHLVYDDGSAGVDEVEFSSTEDFSAGEHMRQWLAVNPHITVLDKSRVSHPDPVSYALRATKVQVESIMQECEAHFKEPCKMVMFISGAGGSYRDKIATVRPYKGNRDPTHKPYHYHAIREYLRTNYGSFVTRGIEADDAVSIFAHNHYATGGESLVIATIDKDLDQIPGQHYNYMNKVFYAITQTEAERWFIYQLLAGDITDNIVGVWKCGPKQAVGILNGLSLRDSSGGDMAGYDRQPSKSVAKRIAIQKAGNAPVSDRQRCVRIPGDTGGNAAAETGEYAEHSGDASGELRRQSDNSIRAMGGSTGTGGGATGEASASTSAADAERSERRDTRADRSGSAVRARCPSWWPTVVRAYDESRSRPACPYASRGPEAIAIEMAQLVKLQEYPGQLWHPYGDLVVPGFGEEDFDG